MPDTKQEAPLERNSKRPQPFVSSIEFRDAYLSQQRLSLLPSHRIFLATAIGICTGGGLGLFHGANRGGLRFRAENTHRFPTTQRGWYFYHKSKNYHIMLEGIKEGVKMGLKLGGLMWLFFVSEAAVDRIRNEVGHGAMTRKDAGSTIVAALGTSAAFSLWNRFPLPTAARTAKTGLVLGITYGLMQDALGYVRGRTPGYIEVFQK